MGEKRHRADLKYPGREIPPPGLKAKLVFILSKYMCPSRDSCCISSYHNPWSETTVWTNCALIFTKAPPSPAGHFLEEKQAALEHTRPPADVLTSLQSQLAPGVQWLG